MEALRSIATVVLGAVLFGCSSQGQGGGADSSMITAATTAMTPAAAEAKAREILQRQIDATKAHDDSVKKTFTADAVVFTHDKATTAERGRCSRDRRWRQVHCSAERAMRSRLRLAIGLVVAIGCGSRDPKDVMREDKKFDFLTENISTRELYARHHADSPAMIATLREAVRGDSRPGVRQNAIVALNASSDDSVLDDFIVGLDDHDSSVVSEAGFSIAARLSNIALPDAARTRALAAMRAHAVALRAAFESPRERVRFNAIMALEAIGDPDLELAKALSDKGSLIRGEAVKLAAVRAVAGKQLSAPDADALLAFVRTNTDIQLHDDALALLVKYAPTRVESPLLAAIADDRITARDLQLVVELQLSAAVPAIVAYLKSHPNHWSKEHLDTLAAFHAVCAGPDIAELFSAQTDKVLLSFLRDALRSLSAQPNASDAELVVWAKKQTADASPCR